MSPTPGANMASSPASEATSNGTPSTNLTTFTPKAATGTTRRASTENNRQRLANIIIGGNNKTGDDVFLMAPTPTKSTKLSPTALVFTPGLQTPFKLEAEVTTPGQSQHRRPAGNIRGHNVGNNGPVAGIGVRPLLNGSTPDRVALTPEKARLIHGVIGGPALDPALFENLSLEARNPQSGRLRDNLFHIGLDGLNQGMYGHSSRISDVKLLEGSFTTDEHLFRAFVVDGVPRDLPTDVIASAFSPALYPSLKYINAVQVIRDGAFSISFGDLRDAKRAFDSAHTFVPGARAIYVSPKTLAAEQERDPGLVSDFEGQAIVSVYFNGGHHGRMLEAFPIISEMKRLLTQCGDLKALHALPPTQQHLREFRVEFWNTDAVAVAKDAVNGTIIETAVLSLEPYTPDVYNLATHLMRRRPEILVATPQTISITGRTTVPADPDYDRLAAAFHHGGVREVRRLNINPNHNAVDIQRILAGIDVRTTIMLRNIPNRVDQLLLKAIIDETSYGCYDFMYLRIDFANNCNVGYAFINFVDAQYIPAFVIARAGQRWNCFNSDKVAEISYATIQGKDCLVSKFRNSSVMLEHPAFRPKLYYPNGHPNAGQEEKFPGPDNPSKMRRSVENAEHVGLFAPRQGQAYREEQRRRRTQFDRGTPGADMELGLHPRYRHQDPALDPVNNFHYPRY